MPRNIEIKARVNDRATLEARVAEFADGGPTTIFQDDSFFHCPDGRLKLRVFAPDRGELIFYRRTDRAGPKTSFYLRSSTSEPDKLRECLTAAWGEAGRVIKQRTLYRIGRTRVHLDSVEALGDFMELEVVLADDADPEDGIAEAQTLMARLGIEPDQLVEGAYLDLMTSVTTRE